MGISFTGINNLSIAKKTSSKFGSYRTEQGEIKQADKKYLDIRIRCDLSDDAEGKHLSEFYNALQKCGHYSTLDYINEDNPKHVEMLVSNIYVKDDVAPVKISKIKLNGSDLILSNRSRLPMYTYLGKLTRDIVALENSTEAQKHYAKIANQSIQDEATYFIDNIL